MQSVSDEPAADDGASVGTWMAPIHLRERFTTALKWAVPTYALTAWFFYLQVQGDPAAGYMLWGFFFFAFGTFMGVRAFGIRERRVFETVEVRYTRGERLKRSARWFVPGVLMLVAVSGLRAVNDEFTDYQWYASFALFLILIGLGLFLLSRERILSAAGKTAKSQLEEEQRAKLERNAKWEAAWDSWPIRYVAAALCVYGAYYFAFEDTNPKTPGWLAIGLAVLALVLARELGTLVLVAGIVGLVGWGLFAGLAALPVSVAIVVGAIIIASALRKR